MSKIMHADVLNRGRFHTPIAAPAKYLALTLLGVGFIVIGDLAGFSAGIDARSQTTKVSLQPSTASPSATSQSAATPATNKSLQSTKTTSNNATPKVAPGRAAAGQPTNSGATNSAPTSSYTSSTTTTNATQLTTYENDEYRVSYPTTWKKTVVFDTIFLGSPESTANGNSEGQNSDIAISLEKKNSPYAATSLEELTKSHSGTFQINGQTTVSGQPALIAIRNMAASDGHTGSHEITFCLETLDAYLAITFNGYTSLSDLPTAQQAILNSFTAARG